MGLGPEPVPYGGGAARRACWCSSRASRARHHVPFTPGRGADGLSINQSIKQTSAGSRRMQPLIDGLIFIVDDDASVREALAWLLRSRRLAERALRQRRGLRAASGRGARLPDAAACLLLDVRMPGTERAGAVRPAGRARPAADAMPVIFLTGHADVPTAVDAVKRGAFDFCEKPFSDNALVDRIEQALEASLRAGEGSAHGASWPEAPHRRADRPRARRDAAGGRGPAQQADRRPACDQRAHGGGPPRARVRQDGSQVGGRIRQPDFVGL